MPEPFLAGNIGGATGSYASGGLSLDTSDLERFTRKLREGARSVSEFLRPWREVDQLTPRIERFAAAIERANKAQRAGGGGGPGVGAPGLGGGAEKYVSGHASAPGRAPMPTTTTGVATRGTAQPQPYVKGGGALVPAGIPGGGYVGASAGPVPGAGYLPGAQPSPYVSSGTGAAPRPGAVGMGATAVAIGATVAGAGARLQQRNLPSMQMMDIVSRRMGMLRPGDVGANANQYQNAVTTPGRIMGWQNVDQLMAAQSQLSQTAGRGYAGQQFQLQQAGGISQVIPGGTIGQGVDINQALRDPALQNRLMAAGLPTYIGKGGKDVSYSKVTSQIIEAMAGEKNVTQRNVLSRPGKMEELFAPGTGPSFTAEQFGGPQFQNYLREFAVAQAKFKQEGGTGQFDITSKKDLKLAGVRGGLLESEEKKAQEAEQNRVKVMQDQIDMTIKVNDQLEKFHDLLGGVLNEFPIIGKVIGGFGALMQPLNSLINVLQSAAILKILMGGGGGGGTLGKILSKIPGLGGGKPGTGGGPTGGRGKAPGGAGMVGKAAGIFGMAAVGQAAFSQGGELIEQGRKEGGPGGALKRGVGTIARSPSWLVRGPTGALNDILGTDLPDPIGGLAETFGFDPPANKRTGKHLYTTPVPMKIGDPVDDQGLVASRNTSKEGTAGVAGLSATLVEAVAGMMRENPNVVLASGYRSIEHQAELYDDYINGRGPLAAKPGESPHNFGTAVDLGPESEYGWINANAAKFGLVRTVPSEAWHFESGGAAAPAHGDLGGMGGDQKSAGGGGATAKAPAKKKDASIGLGGGGGGGGFAFNLSEADILKGIFGSGGSALKGGSGGITGGPKFRDTAAAAAEKKGGGGGGSVGTGAGGSVLYGGTDERTLSINEAANYFRAAGFEGENLVHILGIAIRESGLRTGVKGDTTITDAQWGPSVGLTQIRSLNDQLGTGGTRDEQANIDPGVNAMHAWEISAGGTNWQPWTGNIGWEQHRAQVEDALASGQGDPPARFRTGKHLYTTPVPMRIGDPPESQGAFMTPPGLGGQNLGRGNVNTSQSFQPSTPEPMPAPSPSSGPGAYPAPPEGAHTPGYGPQFEQTFGANRAVTGGYAGVTNVGALNLNVQVMRATDQEAERLVRKMVEKLDGRLNLHKVELGR